ncbi:unnamed protein product [Polarella glacialis]|uniref:Methyltransferase domain-containing protein n=1 Tax=Polarella glacialis TaxID=89957 RepID=A0A813FQR2_POLGL|nr:unnamed protein product [Polarella glacialis]
MVCSSSKHAEKTFWDDQFANSIYGDTYEWVADFEVIAPALQPLLAVQGGAGSCRVLHLGCGNSELPEQLYDFLGVRSCTNVDFSRRSSIRCARGMLHCDRSCHGLKGTVATCMASSRTAALTWFWREAS